MQDRIDALRHSTIQHGPLNRRIYVMKLNPDDLPEILGDLDDLARERGYGKILVKAPLSAKALFEKAGYVQEASIPGFFMGKVSLVFMSKFFSKSRMRDPHMNAYRNMMSAVRQKASEARPFAPSGLLEIVRCTPEDAGEMSRVYQAVFESYPIPIHDPRFLKKNMRGHVDYFSARHQVQIKALAASEKEKETLSVEMTDFATLPGWEGRGLGCRLLSAMESDMAAQGMITAFSIARARSFGMNIIFGKLGYTYGGLLTNNTHIAGQIESMTVWHKRIGTPREDENR
jgi:putative beta-lysine N-acetyltransferase